MAASRRLVAAHKRLVRCVDEKNLRVHALLAQLLHDAAQIVEQLLAARVDYRRHAVVYGRGMLPSTSMSCGSIAGGRLSIA